MAEYIVISCVAIFVLIIVLIKKDKSLQKLNAQNDYLFKIIGSADEGIYVVDLQRRFFIWNKASEKISGYTKQDVLGKRCFDNILDHTDKNGINLCRDQCPLARAIANGCSYGPEVVYLKRKDGRRIPVEVTTGAIHDPSGNVIGGVEIFRDISERLEKERLLIEKKQLEAVIALSGAAAHELRQPLQAIVAMVMVLKRDFTYDCRANECLSHIVTCCYRMNDIIKKMGNITRYELMDYANNIKILDIEKSCSENNK